jgi:high-affinity iron transporter
MINALFVVWRESFEAVLIVGILFSYLKRHENSRRSLQFMWGGVLGGAILSGVLAYAMQRVESELEGNALEYFQAGMLIFAAALMAQMCIWMSRHARGLKSELETGLSEALGLKKMLGVAVLTCLAVSREGFELVMFFYGMSFEAAAKGKAASLLFYSAGGVLLTALTAFLYYRGLKFFPRKLFFQVTTAFLLVTASSFVLAATRRLVQMDVLPTLRDQVWDTSWLLDERSGLGRLISSVTGYESTPALITVLSCLAFWLITLFFYLDVFGRFTSRRVRPVAL